MNQVISMRLFALVVLCAICSGCGETSPATPIAAEPQDADPVFSPSGANLTIDAIGKSLFEVRKGFQSDWFGTPGQGDGPAPIPPEGELELIKYPSPVGDLSAYVTPDPGDGERHPAIIWAHGGWGGIGSTFWAPRSEENDQSGRAFRDVGIVTMYPSFRGECDNPGVSENFFGEVNDYLAAREYLASLPYVDPDRIYAAGHSTGGTLTLLAVAASDQFRAAFSFGGAGDVRHNLGRDLWGVELSVKENKELLLRSPMYFVHSIKTPTYYFEGASSDLVDDALGMGMEARLNQLPFTVCIIQDGDHFDILKPLTTWVAQQILKDTGNEPNFSINSAIANEVFAEGIADIRKRRAEAVADLPIIELTPAAQTAMKEMYASQGLDPAVTHLHVDRAGGWSMSLVDEYDEQTHVSFDQDGFKILVLRESLPRVHGYIIDFQDSASGRGFIFHDRLTMDQHDDQ